MTQRLLPLGRRPTPGSAPPDTTDLSNTAILALGRAGSLTMKKIRPASRKGKPAPSLLRDTPEVLTALNEWW